MDFRILRSFKWVNIPSRVFGGKVEYELITTNTPQYKQGDDWINFPVVELEIPKHPDTIKSEKEFKDMQEYAKRFGESLNK